MLLHRQEQEVESQLNDLVNKNRHLIILSQSDVSGSNDRLQRSIRELKAKRETVFQEKNDIKDMEQLMQMWTIDFMNLVFGRGVEHDEFFNDVVFPEASVYYDFKIEDFKTH